MKSRFQYDAMMEEALRSVVKKALEEVRRYGLSGDHHFFISFYTNRPGVFIPRYLTAQYPTEMTIVLQHQFWELKVEDHAFSVSLSFGGKPERLTIPYAAITSFADPSVKFALQFVPEEEAAVEEQPPAAPQKSAAAPEPARETPRGEGAEVVTLDQFRQKK
ncbi:MAG TPA: ClpXP protease specificity-enhancing factor SspB [Dongiaceae bacterium]|jgi:hypothetical protein|nr:ClpXP protease specificity-enhancing factor SspB [Dongiaceae bacterium]